MSKLIKMISVDGYSTGREVPINFDGNSNIEGENSSGKTTLLKMVPLFYGTSPMKIQRQATNEAGFLEYYLPNITSYLIFVYERDEKKITVVMTGDSSGRLSCRFVTGEYSKDWVLKEDGDKKDFVLSSNWRNHMKRIGFEPSDTVSFKNYTKIIQSNKNCSSLEESDSKIRKQINTMRQLYSYPTEGRDLGNIDLVANAVLESKPKMKEIKVTLENVLNSRGFINKEKWKVDFPAKTIEEFVLLRRSYMSIDGKKDDIQKLYQMYLEFEENLSEKRKVAYLNKARLKSLEEKNIKQDEIIKEINIKKGLLETEEDNQKNSFEKYISEVSGKLSQTQKEHRDLIIKKDPYTEEKIAKWSILLDRHNEFILNEGKMRSDLADLQSGVESITDKYEKFKNSANEEAKNNLNSFNSSIKAAELKITKDIKNLVENKQIERDNLQNRWNKEKKEYDEDYISAVTLIATLKEEKRNLSETKDQKNQLKNLQNNKEINFEKLRKLTNNHSPLKDEISNKKKDRDKLKDQNISDQKSIKELQAEKEKINRTLEGKDGTLISFLRKNVDNWREDIARTINPNLLLETGLNPELSEKDSGSLYGIDLDTSSLEAPDFANDDKLQVQLQKIHDKISEFQDVIDNREKEIKSLSADVIQLSKELSLLDIQISKMDNALNNIKKDIEECETQNDMDKKRRSEEIIKKLEREKNEQEIIKNKINNGLDGYDKKRKEIDSNCELNVEKLGEELKEINENINVKIAENKSSLERKLSDLKILEEQSLKTEGVDTVALKVARDNHKKSQEDCRDSENAKEHLKGYENFMANEWPKNDTLKQKIKEYQNQISDEKGRNHKKEINFKSDKEKLDANLKVVNDTMLKMSNDIHSLKTVHSEMTGLEEYDGNAILANLHTPEYLNRQWNELHKKAKDYTSKGYLIHDEIKKSFTSVQNPDYNDNDFYAKHDAELRESDLYGTREIWYVAAPKLNQYITDAHDIQKKNLINRAGLIGTKLVSFYERLVILDREVKKLGKEVTSMTKSSCNGFEALENLSLNVTSKVSSFDFFPILREFSACHAKWNSNSDKKLPEANYLSQLEKIKSFMTSSELSASVQDSFEIEVSLLNHGVIKKANNDRDLARISSAGCSSLVTFLIYHALGNLIRGGNSDTLVWPIDELAKFDVKNLKSLFPLLNRDNISIISALPVDLNIEVIKDFKNNYEVVVENNSKVRTVRKYEKTPVLSADDELNEMLNNSVNTNELKREDA